MSVSFVEVRPPTGPSAPFNGRARRTGLLGSAAPARCDNFPAMDADSAAKLPLLVAGLAFVLAFIFGAVANRVNFCTMGAVADIVNFGDWKRMRMWVLAIAVAIVGSAVLCADRAGGPGEVDLHGAADRLGLGASSADSCSGSG